MACQYFTILKCDLCSLLHLEQMHSIYFHQRGGVRVLCELFKECLDAVYLHTSGAASYALRRRGDTLFVFFEASNGAADWRRNLDFPIKAYRRMGKTVWFAHRGFLDAWRELEGILSEHICDKSVHKIIVTGYSHGAAIALLCHEYIYFTRPDLQNALWGYGFGCPRVIWGRPSRDVRRRWDSFTVIRNIDDIVTHLPPAVIGYTHVGRLIEIGERGKYSRTDAHRPENISAELQRYEENSF